MATQCARAELRGESVLGEPRDRSGRHVEDHAALGESTAFGEACDRDVGDAGDFLGLERMKYDNLIEAVDQLGPERGEHGIAIAAVFALFVALRGCDAERALGAPCAEVR